MKNIIIGIVVGIILISLSGCNKKSDEGFTMSNEAFKEYQKQWEAK